VKGSYFFSGFDINKGFTPEMAQEPLGYSSWVIVGMDNIFKHPATLATITPLSLTRH